MCAHSRLRFMRRMRLIVTSVFCFLRSFFYRGVRYTCSGLFCMSVVHYFYACFWLRKCLCYFRPSGRSETTSWEISQDGYKVEALDLRNYRTWAVVFGLSGTRTLEIVLKPVKLICSCIGEFLPSVMLSKVINLGDGLTGLYLMLEKVAVIFRFSSFAGVYTSVLTMFK
jgi:hypothetical protein